MKNIQFILPLALVSILSFSQSEFRQTENQKVIAKFTITDAKIDNVDKTSTLTKVDAYTVFYTKENDGRIYLANVWPKNNSQSFGPMYGGNHSYLELHPKMDFNSEETYENHMANFFYFNWEYTNDYNDKTGIARVQIIKIYKPKGIAYVVKIIPEDSKEIIYKGYMEGRFDFSKYD